MSRNDNASKLQVALYALGMIAMSEEQHIDRKYTPSAEFAEDVLEFIGHSVDRVEEFDQELIKELFQFRFARVKS
jgi:hypothetical protein